MADFENLFEPLRFGTVEMKNRVLMPAMHVGMAENGFIKESFIDFYEARACAGPGPGLIIIGGCYTEKRGMGAPNFVALDDDKYIPSLKGFTERIHRHDCLVAAQLYHGGRYCLSFIIGEQPVSASDVPSRFTNQAPRALAVSEIEETQQKYALAARRTRDAGFDAVELICAAGYLVNQFLSPLTNRREDRYGGDLNGRMTFLLETVRAIKDATGEDFPLICRLSGSDFVEGSHTLKESKIVAAEMEEAGVDLISVTGGWHETRVPQITMNVPRGAFVYLAEGIKEAIDSIPVAACNRINDPVLAEEILAEGRADVVAMGRAFIADPNILAKARRGKTGDIRTCIACNQGCFDHVFMLKPITCMLNPRVNREGQTELLPAGKKKKVLVAGGGPAGMEAAWVAAHRGHSVVLCEEGSQLGGQGVLASIPPGREEFEQMVRYLRHQVEIKEVEVRLDTRVTVGLVEEIRPDVLVIATGAKQIVPSLEGVDGSNVEYAWDILAGRSRTGDGVVVVGGGAVGIETGSFLAEKGKDVTVVEMLDSLGVDIGVSTRWTILKDARELGVKLIESCCVQKITDRGVIADRGGEQVELSADTVVLAVGSRPDEGLAEDMKNSPLSASVEVRRIGDCVQARKALEAICEGFDAGLEI